MSNVPAEREFLSSVGLVVTGVSLDPDSLSSQLELQPDSTWRLGDRKRVGSEFHEWGGWKKHLPSRFCGEPFNDDFATWAGLLATKKKDIEAFRSAGCQFVLECFISVRSAVLVELTPAAQRQLANLGMDVSIAIWTGADAG